MKRRHVKQPTPTGDAVARYERLSHTGTTWHDLMPTPADGADGTTGAAFTWPNFNGESFVTIGTPAKLDFSEPFTIQVWALQDIVTPPIQSSERIVSRDPGGGTRNVIISQRDGAPNAGQVEFISWPSGSAKFAQSPAAYNDGLWHHIVAVNAGTGGDLSLFVDSALVASSAGNGGPMIWNALCDWEFGRPQNGGADDFFQGKIDTGRFYSRALSADEILRDYNAGKPAHT